MPHVFPWTNKILFGLLEEKVENSFVPLSTAELTLKEAHSQLDEFGLEQEDVPLIIQLVENPKYDLPGIDIFHGATNLKTHDYIHILLGRGVMIKDEAFVLGFTMGSSNRVTTTEEKLFSFITKYIYPKNYQFTDFGLKLSSLIAIASRCIFLCNSSSPRKNCLNTLIIPKPILM